MTESNSEQGYTVVNMTVRMMLIAVNLVGNSLILAVMQKSRNFSCVTRHLIGHVAVADIVFGCSMTVHASMILGEAMSNQACLGITTVGMISGLCSCWGVCLVFLDNYLSVRRQGPAEPGFSFSKAQWCLVSGWVLTTIYIVVFFLLDTPKNITTANCSVGGPLFTDRSMFSFGIFVLLVSVITMSFMFITLYTIRKRSDALFQEGSRAQNVRRQQNLKMRSRVVRLFAIIAVGFIISWCPVSIAVCVAVLCTNRCGITEDHFKLLVSFMSLNSVMNIIVYVIKDKKFRQDAKRVILCQINQVAPQNNTVAMVTTRNTEAVNSARILNSTLTATGAHTQCSIKTTTSASVVTSASAATSVFADVTGTAASLDTATSSTDKASCDSSKQMWVMKKTFLLPCHIKGCLPSCALTP